MTANRLAWFVLFVVWVNNAAAERCIVRVPDRDGAWSVGQGVLIAKADSRGIVLSARHVIRDAGGSARCRFASTGQEHVAKDLAILPNGDLAGFLLDGLTNEKPTRFASRDPSGMIGTFRGLAPRLQAGWYSTDGLPQLIWRRPSPQGDSGGPVYNEAGEVVSILWGSTGNESHAESWITAHHMVHECSQRFGIPAT